MSETAGHTPDEYLPTDERQALVEEFFDQHNSIDDTDSEWIKIAQNHADTQLDLMEDEAFSAEASNALADHILELEQAIEEGDTEKVHAASRNLSRALNNVVGENRLSDEQEAKLEHALYNALTPDKRHAFESDGFGEDMTTHVIDQRMEMFESPEMETVYEAVDETEATPEAGATPETEASLSNRVFVAEDGVITISLEEGEEFADFLRVLHEAGYTIEGYAGPEADATADTSEAGETDPYSGLDLRAREAIANGDLEAFIAAQDEFLAALTNQLTSGEIEPSEAQELIDHFNRLVDQGPGIASLEGAHPLRLVAGEGTPEPADSPEADDTPEATGEWNWKDESYVADAKGAIARKDLEDFNAIKAAFIAALAEQIENGNVDPSQARGIVNEFSAMIGSLDKFNDATHISMSEVNNLIEASAESTRPPEYIEAGERLKAEFEEIRFAYNETAAKMRRSITGGRFRGLRAEHQANEEAYNDVIARMKEHIREGFEMDGKLETAAGRAELVSMLNAGTVSEFNTNAAEQLDNMKDTIAGRFFEGYKNMSRGKKLLIAAGIVGSAFTPIGIAGAAAMAGGKGFTSIMSRATSDKFVTRDQRELNRRMRRQGPTSLNATDLITQMSERRVGKDIGRTRIAALGGAAIGSGLGLGTNAALGYVGDRIGDGIDAVGDAFPGDFEAPPEFADVEVDPDGNVGFGEGLGPDSAAETAAENAEAAAERAAEAAEQAEAAAQQATEAATEEVPIAEAPATPEGSGDFVDIAERGDGWVNTIMDLADAEGIEGVDSGEAYQVYVDNESAFANLPESYDMGNGDYGINAPGEVTIPEELRTELVNDLEGYGEATATPEAAAEATADQAVNPYDTPEDIDFADSVDVGENRADVFGDYLQSRHPELNLSDAQVDRLWDDLVKDIGWSDRALEQVIPGANETGVFGSAGETGITDRGIAGIEDYLRRNELVS